MNLHYTWLWGQQCRVVSHIAIFKSLGLLRVSTARQCCLGALLHYSSVVRWKTRSCEYRVPPLLILVAYFLLPWTGHGASGFAIHVEVWNGPKEFDFQSPKVMWWRLVGDYPNYLLVQFGAWSYITQRKTFEHSIKVGDRNSFCFLQSHRRNVPPETALSKYAWSPWSPISVVTGRTSLCCFLLLLRPGDHQLGSLSMDRGISGNWDQAMGNRAKRKHWLFSTPETWLVWLVWLVINQNFFCEENCAWSHTLQK